MVERPRPRIVRVVQHERTHQRQSQRVRLPGQRVRVWQQPVAQLREAPADCLHLGTVSPRHVLAPDPAVRAKDRAEGAELEPARVQLTGLRHRMKEAAHVGPPVRHARQPGAQSERDLRLQRRKVVVHVARPARGAEPLHPGGARAAEQEHAVIRPRGRLALGECLVTEAIVDVVQPPAVARGQLGRRRRSLAAVEPPAADAERDEPAVRRPPPVPRRRVGEVEVTLPLAVARDAAVGALVSGRQ